MQIFKCFMSILKKNKASILVYAGIFTVLILVITNANKDQNEQTYKSEDIPFTVINRDNSELGKRITKYLSQKNTFVKEADDKAKLQNDMFYRNIYYVLIVPEGFEDAVINDEDKKLVNMKVKDSAMGYYLDMEVDAYMKTLESYMASGYSIDEAMDKTDDTMKKEADIKLADSEKVSSIKTSYFYYRVIPYIFIAMIMSAIGPVFIAFNKKEVKKRVACSSLTVKNQNLQIILGCVSVCSVVMVAFNVLAIILYHNDFNGNEILMNILNTFCFVLISFSLTYLFGSIATSDPVLAGMVNVVALGTSFLGGVFVPVEVFGKSMKAVAKFMPTYWYIYANDAIVGIKDLSADSLSKVFTGFGIQLIFAAAIFSIAMVLTKRQRMRA